MAPKSGTSRHHILFERQIWMARPETRRLRGMGSLIVKMEDDAHAQLHQVITTIPAPNVYMARYMLDNFIPRGHILDTVDHLSTVVEDSSKNPHARGLEIEHGQLIVACLQAQKPFIQEGAIYGDA